MTDSRIEETGRIIILSGQIENRLKAVGATGAGLHELTTSLQDRLPPEMVKLLRYIASVRNRTAHEGGAPEVDLAFFEDAAQTILAELGAPAAELPPEQPATAESPPEDFDAPAPPALAPRIAWEKLAWIPGLHLLYPGGLLLRSFEPAAGAGIGLALYAIGGIFIATAAATGEKSYLYFAAAWLGGGWLYAALTGFQHRRELRCPTVLYLPPGVNLAWLLWWAAVRCDRPAAFAGAALLASAGCGVWVIVRHGEFLAGSTVLAAGYLGGLIGARLLKRE